MQNLIVLIHCLNVDSLGAIVLQNLLHNGPVIITPKNSWTQGVLYRKLSRRLKRGFAVGLLERISDALSGDDLILFVFDDYGDSVLVVSHHHSSQLGSALFISDLRHIH